MGTTERGLRFGLLAMVLPLAWMHVWVPSALLALYALAAPRLLQLRGRPHPPEARPAADAKAPGRWAASAPWLWAGAVGIALAHELLALPAHLGVARWALVACAGALPLSVAAIATASSSGHRLAATALGLGVAQLALFLGLDIGEAEAPALIATACTATAVIVLAGASLADGPGRAPGIPAGTAPTLVGVLFLVIALVR